MIGNLATSVILTHILTGALVIGNLATSDLRSSALVETPELVETLFKVLDCDYSSDEMLVKVN